MDLSRNLWFFFFFFVISFAFSSGSLSNSICSFMQPMMSSRFGEYLMSTNISSATPIVFDEHQYFFCNTHCVSQDFRSFCKFFYKEWNRVIMTVGIMSFWLQFLNLHGNSWLFAKHVACSIVALASTLVKLKLKSDHCILNNGDDGATFYIRDHVKYHEIFECV